MVPISRITYTFVEPEGVLGGDSCDAAAALSRPGRDSGGCESHAPARCVVRRATNPTLRGRRTGALQHLRNDIFPSVDSLRPDGDVSMLVHPGFSSCLLL